MVPSQHFGQPCRVYFNRSACEGESDLPHFSQRIVGDGIGEGTGEGSIGMGVHFSSLRP